MSVKSSPLSFLCGGFAVALPFLVAASVPPTSTFFNQAAAAAGMGLWLCIVGVTGRAGEGGAPRASKASVVTVGVLLLLAGLQLWSHAPMGQRLVPCGVLLLAAALCAASARAARAGQLAVFAAPTLWALMVAGGVSTVIAALQVFWPEATGNAFIAYPTVLGRAVGNMRQPNQLSTLLLWAMAGTVWWGVWRRWHWGAVAALLAGLTLGVLWTSSRTGMVGILLVAAWGLIDTSLPVRLRAVMIMGLPALYTVGWWGMEQWSAHTGHFFYGDDQVKKTLHGDPSSSRGGIWANTLALIAQHPWGGVGAGAFNFVWSMTPFPGRPVAFFDHSHNVVLQLMVESGVPAALLVLAGLGVALWWGLRGLFHARAEVASCARACWFALAVVAVHSLLEYPLWYSYFLLPAAVLAGCACGLGEPLAWPRRAQTVVLASARRARWWRTTWPVAAGMLALAGTGWAVVQYHAVAVIFDPSLSWGEPEPLAQRIERGRRSVLFGHHADYAAVTMAEHPEAVFNQFDRTVYHLLDTRLMMAYARALAGRGDTVRAAHVAARLREFRNPASDDFFAVCQSQPLPQPAPFQCLPDPRLDAASLTPQAARVGPVRPTTSGR